MSFATDPDYSVRSRGTESRGIGGAMTFSLVAPRPSPLACGPLARMSNAFERRIANPLMELAAGASVRMIKEPKTGTTFPEEFCTRDRISNCSQLTGVGVRSKRLLGLKNLNIYSIGLYVDPSHTIEKFQKYGYLSQSALKQTSGMYQDVCRSPTLEKTIRLVVVYGGLKPEQIRKAFEERLVPVMKQDKRALQRFMGHFSGLKLHKGSTLVFTAHGGSLTTTVDSKELGTIASHELCNSLFSVYLGPDPVSKECKDDFAVGMFSLLQDAKRAGKFS